MHSRSAAIFPRFARLSCLVALCAMVSVSVFVAAPAEAQTLTTLHTFGLAAGGQYPAGHLAADATGNLYGMTFQGGTFNRGTIFKLSPPPSGGQWTETVIYNFTNDADDNVPGGYLIVDPAGKLYGTTTYGGTGSGTVFQLAPPTVSGGAWTRYVLYRFSGKPDGVNPIGTLIMDAAQNIYGETWQGGACSSTGDGTVFKLSAPTTLGGSWNEQVLYSFQFDCGASDGSNPTGGLAIGKGGVLFGVTSNGGVGLQPGGTVFRLNPPTASHTDWKETVLHAFNPFGTVIDGFRPVGGVIVDNKNNVYGTTVGGGGTRSTCPNYGGCGVVYEVSPPAIAGGAWTENILYSLTGGDGGDSPMDSLLLDAVGNLYGEAPVGGDSTSCGPNGDCGTIFELNPPSTSGSPWSEVTLHSFTSGPNGVRPVGGLTFGQFHRLYGVTQINGSAMPHAKGTVFKLVP